MYRYLFLIFMSVRTIHMRKAIAILSLTVFLAMQYGKLVTYWHCKISAAIAQTICDCEKQLIDIHKEDKGRTDPVTIAKEKTEEHYFFAETALKPVNEFVFLHTTFPTYSTAIPESYQPAIFQPPRVL